MKRALLLTACLLASGLFSCTTGQTPGPTLTQVPCTSNSITRLQFAVGTANIYGTSTGLNVVSTMRQPNGTSSCGVNTPTLTGPFVNTNAPVAADAAAFADPYTTMYFMGSGPPQQGAGPSWPEKASGSSRITGTSQSVHPGTPFCDTVGPPPAGFTQCPPTNGPNTSTFGQSGGVFAMGIAPYNAVANTAQAYSYEPYPQPMYDNAVTHPTFVPWGGPPAFDPDGNGMGTRDGLIILGTDSFGFNYFLGVGEGINVFEGVTPGAGTYTLNVIVSYVLSGGGQGSVTFTTPATMGSTATLPTLTAPFVTPDGTGGGSFTASVPGGVTEELIQIINYGPGGGPLAGGGASNYNCHGPKGTSFAPVYFTVAVHSSGAYDIGKLHGANNEAGGPGSLTPTPSICNPAQNNAAWSAAGKAPLPNAGDNFTVQVIGFDYPEYEAAFGLTQSTTPQAPPITGPSGQSDITISLPVEEDWTSTGYVATTLSVARHPLLRSRARSMPFANIMAPERYRRLGVPTPRI